MKVMVLIGGISAGSLNRRFFEAVAGLRAGGSSASIALDFTVADIASLPHYSQDLENTPPASVLALRGLAASSDAVLIVTPEYNRSIPGVLKNALDWGSRPPGTNIWAHKPTAVMGATAGGIGTFGAQQHLRNICSWLDMPVMDQPTVYFNAATGMMNSDGTPGADGDRLTDSSAVFLSKFLEAFGAWIVLFQGGRPGSHSSK